MTAAFDERQAAVDALRRICHEIGCSGWSPGMCKKNPQQCEIIFKVLFPGGPAQMAKVAARKEVAGAEGVGDG